MSKIVLNLSGEPDWSDPSKSRDYQFTKLGRENGETLLTEVLPLPALNSNSWPYMSVFATRAEYESKTRRGGLIVCSV
jgi:hypothetical protein